MIQKNQQITLHCDRLGSELEGVCSHEGMAVFVLVYCRARTRKP